MKKFISNNKIIGNAFNAVCLNKFKLSGYVDMSKYISHNESKFEIQSRLKKENSPLKTLFDQNERYPRKNDIKNTWDKFLKLNKPLFEGKLSEIEAQGIIYWFFSAIRKKEERQELIRQILSREATELRIADKCVFYDNSRVEINICSSIFEVNKVLSQISDGVFYRGHSNANYMLQPSIYRSSGLINNESKLYNEIQIMCPDEFKNCMSAFERLVKMQHYGLPTRLLDITSNPLIALYFACNSDTNSYGELLILKSPDEFSQQYYNNDVVAIISNLAQLNEDVKTILKTATTGMTARGVKKAKEILLNAVRIEKPYVYEEDLNCIMNSYVVCALKNNNRIVKQDGAFIVCGLGNTDHLERYRLKSTTDEEKKIVVLINNKAKAEILKNLDAYSINQATVFPEIENISEYLKTKYQNQ